MLTDREVEAMRLAAVVKARVMNQILRDIPTDTEDGKRARVEILAALLFEICSVCGADDNPPYCDCVVGRVNASFNPDKRPTD